MIAGAYYDSLPNLKKESSEFNQSKGDVKGAYATTTNSGGTEKKKYKCRYHQTDDHDYKDDKCNALYAVEKGKESK